MTDKAYIVANKEQELDVLNKFEENGLVWIGGERPTEWVTSEEGALYWFPYVLIEREYGGISWSAMDQLQDETVVYDGRNEDEEVDTKYKVTQEFMNELIEWRDDEGIDATSGKQYNYVNDNDLDELPAMVEVWWVDNQHPIERNNRLIAIIQWLNGEDVFEVEKPHKFVVRSEHADRYGDYNYVKVVDNIALSTDFQYAMTFDTREEAQEWANSHQVVVEIDEEGNEVE